MELGPAEVPRVSRTDGGPARETLVRPRMLRNPACAPLKLCQSEWGKGRKPIPPLLPPPKPNPPQGYQQRGGMEEGGSATGITCTPGLSDKELLQQTSPGVQANPIKPTTEIAA